MSAGTIGTRDAMGHIGVIRPLLARLRPAAARRDVDAALSAASALAGIARDKSNGTITIPSGGCRALAHWLEATIEAWPPKERKACARRIVKELGKLGDASRPIYAHGAPIAWLELMLWDGPDALHRFIGLDPRLLRCWSACPLASWQVHLARAVGLDARVALEGLRAALVLHQADWVNGVVPIMQAACEAVTWVAPLRDGIPTPADDSRCRPTVTALRSLVTRAVAPERSLEDRGASASEAPASERARSELAARLTFEALAALSLGDEERAWSAIAGAAGALAAEPEHGRANDRTRTFARALREVVPDSVVEATFARACGFEGARRALSVAFGEVFVLGVEADKAHVALAGGERRTVVAATLHDPAPDGRALPFLLRSLALELLASQRLFARLSALGYGAFGSAERTVVCAQDVVREHANGGLDQYFFNSSGSRAHDAPEALATLGAAPHAAILERAIAAFGGRVPADTEERRRISAALSEESRRALSALDEELGKERSLGELIVRFIRRERETFEPILAVSADICETLDS